MSNYKLVSGIRKIKGRQNVIIEEDVDVKINTVVIKEVIDGEMKNIDKGLQSRIDDLQGEILLLNGEISTMVTAFDELRKGLRKEVDQIIEKLIEK